MAPKSKPQESIDEPTNTGDDVLTAIEKRLTKIENVLDVLRSHCPKLQQNESHRSETQETPTLETLNARLQTLEAQNNTDTACAFGRPETFEGPYSAFMTSGSYSMTEVLSTLVFIIFAVIWYRQVFQRL